MQFENEARVTRVGTRYGVEQNGNIIRSFDTLTEAIQFITSLKHDQ